MCVATCDHEVTRAHRNPGAGVTGGYKPPGIGAECGTGVLWESSKGSESQSPLSSRRPTSFRMPTHPSCGGCCHYLVLLFTSIHGRETFSDASLAPVLGFLSDIQLEAFPVPVNSPRHCQMSFRGLLKRALLLTV